jgi:UDP-glucose:(heptosyl)LPS alpha-1,3-glucosyltransferase
VYNGVDLERFRPENVARDRAAMRERLGIPQDAFVALLVGNDYWRKGITTLIDVVAEINARSGLPGGRPVTVRVVGRERHAREQEILRLTHAKGVWSQVKLHGPQRAVDRWYGCADVFVLPSRFDIFGNVVLEAMATGIPAIVSSAAGASECVEDGKTGFVVGPRDVAAHVARFIELADESKRRAMGERACEAARRYSWDRHFARILEIYDEVRDAKRARATARASQPSGSEAR